LPSPPLSAEEIRAFRHNQQAQTIASRLRRDLAQKVARLELETLLALTWQLTPAENDSESLEKFTLEIAETMSEFEAHGRAVRAVAQADKAHKAPLMSAAVRRVFAAERELGIAEKQIELFDEKMKTKREALIKAGLKGKKLEDEMACQCGDKGNLQAKQEALSKEICLLESFISSGEDRYLPEGFEAIEPIRVTVVCSINGRVAQ
jgi:hypothetical protein